MLQPPVLAHFPSRQAISPDLKMLQGCRAGPGCQRPVWPKTIWPAELRAPAAMLVQAAPGRASASAQTMIASSAKAPFDCLPEGLRTVLQDVQARFGTVTLVSTRELHTDNHSPGSARHKMHGDCRAVDFKVEGDLTVITAYLRSRPEVSGVNS